ncbi:MAG: tRNA pseudouridine(55) synthase TruB [Gemmatimonadota bacterium]|nr:tRNA pseudouridine(55) synthase TruB [Gemmatimonadota bacterium]
MNSQSLPVARKGIHGVLPVDKPAGLTSHDVVARVRRILGVRKVGHSGTLDPLATGLLVLCVGGATRFASYLTSQDKTYRARILLGASTTTDDAEGEVLFRYSGDLEHLVTRQSLQEAIDSLAGEVMQRPPLYSSKKIGGVPAYRLARRGETPDLSPVPVRIEPVQVLEVRLPEIELEFTCSAGTYLRAFARDLGSKLECGGHLKQLVRKRSGGLGLDEACTLDEICRAGREGIKNELLLPVGKCLTWMPAVSLDSRAMESIYHGRTVGPDGASGGFSLEDGQETGNGRGEKISLGKHEVRMLARPGGSFLGIGLLEVLGANAVSLRPKRLMIEEFPFG